MAKNHFIMDWPLLGISVECEPRENDINGWIYDWWIERMPFRYVQSHAFLTGGVINSLNVRMPDAARTGRQAARDHSSEQDLAWPGAPCL